MLLFITAAIRLLAWILLFGLIASLAYQMDGAAAWTCAGAVLAFFISSALKRKLREKRPGRRLTS